MAVTVIWRNEHLEIQAPTTIEEMLASLDLPAELYLVIRDGVILSIQDEIRDGDTIRLVGVISGG